MLFIFDKDLNVISTMPERDISEGSITEQINGEYSCTLVVPWNNNTQDLLKEFNHIGFYMCDEFQIFQIRSIVDIRTSLAEREIYCEHLSYQLSNYITEDRRVVNGTAKDIIRRILSDTDWKAGEIASLGEKTYSAYYIETRKALFEVAEAYGGELRFRIVLNEAKTGIESKYVDLLSTRGENTGIRFSPNKNLNEITREIDTLDMRTRLIGRGKSPRTENGGQERRIQFTDVVWSTANGDLADKPAGQNWIADTEAEAKYGIICGVYEDNSETPEELIQKTWEALKPLCKPTITYKASLSFIRKYMGDKQVLSTGDHFTIIDDDLGLHLNTRILQITRDWHSQEEGSVTMGQFYKTIGNNSSEIDNIKGEIDNIRDTINGLNPDDTEATFPDTVPTKPVVTTKGLFASIHVQWTYEYAVHYEYAVYGSQTKGFAPNEANLLYRGKGSSYLHYTTPNQTWYYRVCAFNSHGNRSEYSIETVGNSLRITDASLYMENASIKDAQIGELRLDRGWVGQLTGHHIDARELTVTDGNGDETLKIDSAGRVYGSFSKLHIAVNSDSNVPTKSEVSNAIEESQNATDAKVDQKIEENISGVQTEISEITTAMNMKIADITTANNNTLDYINLITSDNYVTDGERSAIKHVGDEIVHQFNKMMDTLEAFDTEYLSTYRTSLQTCYDSLHESMTHIISGGTDGLIEFRAKLTLYYNAYHDCLYAISNFTKDELTDLRAEIKAEAGKIEMTLTQTNKDLSEVKQYMSFTPDGWLELHGSINGTPSSFKTQLSDTKLSFWDNGQEVAYVSNKKLNIENAEIQRTLKVGNYIMTKSASDGIVFRKEN